MTEGSASSTPQWSREDLINRFIDLSNAVSSQMRPTRSEAFSDVELTMLQFRALSLLNRGPLRIGDIASRLGLRLSAANNLMRRLEEKHLVERVPDQTNRRITWFRLTSLGQRESENLWDVNRNLLESIAGSLTDEELQTVVETFEVLSSALRRNDTEEAP